MNATTTAALRLYRQLGLIPGHDRLAEAIGPNSKGKLPSLRTISNHLAAAVEAGWILSLGFGLYVPAHFRLIGAPLRAALEEAEAGCWEDPDPRLLLGVALGGVDLDDAEGVISSEIARAWRDLADKEAASGLDRVVVHRLLRDEYEAEGVVDPAAWRAADAVLTQQNDAVDAAAAAAYAAVGEAVTRARCLRLA